MPQIKLSSRDLALMRTVIASSIERYNEAIAELRKTGGPGSDVLIAQIEEQSQRLRNIEQRLLATGLV